MYVESHENERQLLYTPTRTEYVQTRKQANNEHGGPGGGWAARQPAFDSAMSTFFILKNTRNPLLEPTLPNGKWNQW